MSSYIEIGKRKVGKAYKPYIIAEIAQAHDGSLGLAHSFIDLAKECGADAVKFQTHFAEEESTKEDQFRVNSFPQDISRYDYWKRMEFSENLFFFFLRTLFDELSFSTPLEFSLFPSSFSLGSFLSTPFSIKAFNLLNKLGIKAWKIGSGETQNIPLIKKMMESNVPLIISTGLSSWDEIDLLVSMAKNNNSNFVLMQCTTAYPTSPEEIGLNILSEISDRYDCVFGLSDHSGNIFSPISALALGSSLIEVHLTYSKSSFGADAKASLEPSQFKSLTEGRDFIYKMLKSPIKKDILDKKTNELKVLFGRSLVASKNIKKGEKLTLHSIEMKKPGGGLRYTDIEFLNGKVANRAYKKDDKFDKSIIK